MTRKIECKICNEVLSSKKSLIKHLLDIHDISNKQYHVQYLNIVHKKCKTCGEPSKWSDRAKGFLDYCSKSCGNTYASSVGKAAVKAKYGVDNISQIPGHADRIKKTKKERYNNENFSNPEKGKETCMERYGVTNGSKTMEARKKISKKVSSTLKQKFDEQYYLNKYKATKREGNYLFFGDEKIHVRKHLYKQKFNFPDTTDGFKNFYKKFNYKTSENFVKNYFPIVHKKINKLCSKSFRENKFMFGHGISQPPTCPVCNDAPRKWTDEGAEYYVTCGKTSCMRKSSGGERELREFIASNTVHGVIPNHRIDNVEFDVFIPDLSLAFEYNGLYWHSEEKKGKNFHVEKSEFAGSKGIQLVHVWEDDWVYKRGIVESIVLNKLGKSEKIYARKCEIVVPTSKETKEFMKNNHLQGASNDSIRFGLMHDGELVSVMTFGKTRMITNRKEGFELLRFSNKKGISVTGGASRLLKQFIRKHSPDKLLSYANTDISNGNLYEQLGFVKIKQTIPGYWWCADGRKYHRSNFMKHQLVSQGFDEKMTERQIMESRGYFRVFDSGNFLFEYKNIGTS